MSVCFGSVVSYGIIINEYIYRTYDYGYDNLCLSLNFPKIEFVNIPTYPNIDHLSVSPLTDDDLYMHNGHGSYWCNDDGGSLYFSVKMAYRLGFVKIPE